MKNLIAFSAGRTHGNTEIFMKEALMAAEEKGVHVEFFRLRDFEINKCNGCTKCGVSLTQADKREGDLNNCIYKDDVPFLITKFLDCDGIIYGGPIYTITPSSLFFNLRDRVFGPKLDVGKIYKYPDDYAELPWVKGRFHPRPGAIISVGGAETKHWTGLGMPNFYTAAFSAQTQIVDFMDVKAVADLGAATLREDLIARAHKLGENIAQAMLEGDLSYRGDVQGLCPSCHLDLMTLDLPNKKITCPVCGITGDLVVENGEIRADFSAHAEENAVQNRFTVQGLITHQDETQNMRLNVYNPRKEEVQARSRKYIDYKACEVASPTREAKKQALREQYAKNAAQNGGK